jgi:hypothetical protein
MAVSSVGAHPAPAPKPAPTASRTHPTPATQFKSLSHEQKQRPLTGPGHHVNKLV